MKYSTLIFDLDGTLIDQFSAIHKSVNHVQKCLGFEISDYKTVKSAVGGSVRLTLERLFQHASLNETLPLFKPHFESIMMDEVFILPGILDFLKASQKSGIKMAVFTNKIGGHARSTLEHLKIDKYFELILGAEDTPYRKPDQRFTEHLLQKLNTLASDCCLIGDSPFDWETGSLVDIPVFLVATGTHTISQLKRTTNSNAIYSDINALATELFNYK